MNNQLILLLLMFIVTNSCERKDPCDDLVNGVYQFPELPENHTMTNQEITEFLDLPVDICECISTEGLIETCLNYPELGLIYAGSNFQSGYDLLVKERFRGIRELETRPDRGTFLLRKYQTIDPLGYDPSWELAKIGEFLLEVTEFEIIFSQYINLETITMDETVELIEIALGVYDKKMEDIANYSLHGLECSTALLGRLMYQNGYGEMTDLYNMNNLVRDLLAFYGPTSLNTVELVYNLSKEYLNYLKNI